MIARLNRALYGTKQAGKLFNDLVVKFMTEYGFTQSSEDPCLFFKITENGNLMIVGLYVDDTLIAVHDEDMKEYENFIRELKSRFKIEEIGDAKWILGVKIDYNKQNGILKMTQKAYIEKILKRFEMYNRRNKSDTPAIRIPIDRSALDDRPNADYPFMEAVGALLYLAICTRPDILYAVNYASQHMLRPTNVDVSAVKRIFRYVNATSDLGLIFRRSNMNDYRLKIYADAAWDVTKDSKSQTGYVIKLGKCNIYSVSRKQNVIAQSSCESEYIAMTDASNECIGLRYLINELMSCENFNQKIDLYTDSTAAISNATNMRQSKMRHLNRRLNVIKERINSGTLDVHHIKTDDQIADILTKPLMKDQFRRLRDELLGHT
jgi:hypothetical protein